MPIESSTVTYCSRPPVSSRSVRPRQGRIRPSRPWWRWLRLSLVEIWTVRPTSASAAVVTAVSGVAAAKLPPRARKTSTAPARIASIAATTS